MSSKATTSRRDSKLATVIESVVTRRRSAQQKRQLRNKASSIKRISQFAQLLLSPTKSNTSKSPPTKSKSNVSKNVVTVKTKKETAQEKKDDRQYHNKRDAHGKFIKKMQSPRRNVEKLPEYYPNKLKRNFEGKKVVLKAKHEMKVVVGTRIGKRKLVLPQKGAGPGLRSPPPKLQKLNPIPKLPKPKPQPARAELSIEDLVHLHNDDSLDDEDWLEILTCPSPVWWEDPPDPAFDDEPMLPLPVTTKTTEIQQPVRKRQKTHPKKTKLESPVNITEVLTEGNVKALEMKKADIKFMRKRSKLENLLGNIRNKINDGVESGYSSDKLNLKCESDVEIKKTEVVTHDEIESNSKINCPVSRKEKRTSESTEEDLFSNFRDDDLLNDLENIEIPMKPNERDKCEDENTESSINSSSNICKDKSYGLQKANAEEFSDCIEDKSDPNEDPHKVGTFQSFSREENNENFQISKLTTTSIEKDVSSSPMSVKSVNSMSDETYETFKSQDVDTISDTNIKFIDEDETSKACEIGEKTDRPENAQTKKNNDNKIYKISNVYSIDKNEQSKQLYSASVVKSNNILDPRKEKDCMVVYKIISNEKDTVKTINKDCKNNTMISKINEMIKASKEYNSFKANLQSSETSKTKLDSFFKKYKNHYQSRQTKIPETVNNNSIDTSDNDKLTIKNNDKNQHTINTNKSVEIGNKNEFEKEIFKENTQNKNKVEIHDDEKSIVVPNSSTGIKYCLKCSCIFDTNNCDYCVKKGTNSTENHNSSCKSSKLTNREKNIEVESFICDLCKTGNND